jgi:3-keto-5-aminohexanoate cleavage enzyme
MKKEGETLLEKLIITNAVTGSLTTRQQNPNVPYTPREIAEEAVRSWKAGAGVVHLHTREPDTGKAVQDAELYKEIIKIIRNECDVIVNVTTGGGPGMSLETRLAVIPELSADPALKPEMASLNCGSLNFGILDRKKREFILDDVQMNPWGHLLKFADTMLKYGVKPELEIYDAGMLNNAEVLLSLDALEHPLHYQFVLGVMGGMQPTVDNLVFLKNSTQPNATWSLCAVGLKIFDLGPTAIGAGGNIRVGFEDCVHISRGILADHNAQMVAKVKRMSEEMGREVATPQEARKILNL